LSEPPGQDDLFASLSFDQRRSRPWEFRETEEPVREAFRRGFVFPRAITVGGVPRKAKLRDGTAGAPPARSAFWSTSAPSFHHPFAFLPEGAYARKLMFGSQAAKIGLR
jgi:hypothetical protein